MSDSAAYLSHAVAAEETWSHHGRSPLLEMRHTVDDTLQVATNRVFLPFRAMCHRNRDSLVVFSEAAKEVRARSGAGPHRGVILTDKHLYVITMPSTALFAPSAGGGMFSWREFGRLCYAKATPHVVFQFVSGIVALQFSTQREVERLCKVAYSTTGLPPEEISVSDLDAAKRGGREFNAAFRGFDLESTSTAAQLRGTTTASMAGVGALSAATSNSGGGGGVVPPALQRSYANLNATTASAQGGGSSAPSAGSPGRVGAEPTSVDNMLRFILGGADGGTNYETLYPTAQTQTEIETRSAFIQARATTVDRATSPIRFLPEGFRGAEQGVGWGGGGGGGAGGGGGGHGGGGPHQYGDDRSDTMSSMSDFDHNDVWRSLHGTPFKQQQQQQLQQQQQMQLQQQQQRGRRAASPPPSSMPYNLSSRQQSHSPAGYGSGMPQRTSAQQGFQNNGSAFERRIHFEGRDDGAGGGRYDEPTSASDTPTNVNAALVPTATDNHNHGPSDDPLEGTLGQRSATSAGLNSTIGMFAGTATSGASGLELGGSPQNELLRRQQSQRATLAFDSFLGVLATYRNALQDEGIDSTSKLLKLTDGELQDIMDAAGIAKPGHRTLLLSKVNLAKQARAAKKVVGS